MVNLELYRVFYAVAKTGSLTKAANELFISQPAVSQAIKQLEGQIGGQLFVRTSKGMRLTEEGLMMQRYVGDAITLLNEAQDKFNQMTKTNVGIVRIGASDTICKHFLLEYISSFRKIYPEINIKVTNRTSTESLELLKEGNVDIAFVNLPIEIGADFDMDFMHELTDCFVANQDYAKLSQGEVKLSQLSDYPLLMLELQSNSRRAIAEYAHSINVHLHPEIELGSLDLLVDFAMCGLGIACVPREYVLKELQSGTLFEIKTRPALPVRGVGLVSPKKGYTNFAVKEFMKHVKKDG